MTTTRALGVLTVLGLAAAGCGPTNLAAKVAEAPSNDREAKCGVTKSQAEPLIVEWPSSSRAKIEALTRTGVVAVRYSGCEMEVLASCTAPGKYQYVGITPKHDRVTIKDADDLYANIPLGAAKLESKLEKSGQLDVSMTIVGRLSADRKVVRAKELEGPDCGKATHIVSALTVGAFDFYAGAEAQVAGSATGFGAAAGGKSSTARELLNSDGKPAACDVAKTSDTHPPEGCGAVVRLEVVPLGQAIEATEARKAPTGVATEPAASHHTGGELKFEAPDQDQKFGVTVTAGGVTQTCAEPVTYYKPCRIFDVPEGKALVKVTGDANFERDIKVEGEGRTRVALAHRGWSYEITTGVLALGGGIAVAYGLSDSHGFQGTGQTGDIILVTIGGTFLFIGGLGLLGALLSPHDQLAVLPTVQARPAAWRWSAPTTLHF